MSTAKEIEEIDDKISSLSGSIYTLRDTMASMSRKLLGHKEMERQLFVEKAQIEAQMHELHEAPAILLDEYKNAKVRAFDNMLRLESCGFEQERIKQRLKECEEDVRIMEKALAHAKKAREGYGVVIPFRVNG